MNNPSSSETGRAAVFDIDARRQPRHQLGRRQPRRRLRRLVEPVPRRSGRLSRLQVTGKQKNER